jgi:pimeloyl-ACP methyl ester carboxylesterase
MSKPAVVGSGLLVAAMAGAGLAASRSRRRWAAAPDPTDGNALSPVEGTARTVTTEDGAEISLVDSGPADGPPVVLVHGWTEDRRVWSPVVRQLASSGLRLIAYDQRGHGSSGIGRAGYTIEALAADLKAVVEGLDLQDVVVAGHSMGGMAAQAFCVEYPDVAASRLKALVLVATACGDLGRGAAVERYGAKLMSSPFFDKIVSSPRIGPSLVRGSVGKKPVLAHLEAMATMLAATPGPTRGGFLTAMSSMDLSKGIASIAMPVSILVGSHDQLTPLKGAQKMVSLIPGAQLEVVPDAGHMLTYEAPDLVARFIRQAAEAPTEAVSSGA